MIPQNQTLITSNLPYLTQINNIKSRLSRSVTFKNASKLLLNFGGFGGNFYYLIGLKIDKKKYQSAAADTKFVEFLKGFMSLKHSRKNKNENHSHNSTGCRYCGRDTVNYSAGTGIHILRADCRSCRRWWWVSKVEAHILIESGILQSVRNNDGKQLSLFGGEFDA